MDVVRFEGADQGVLAPARPDDEDAHAWSLPAELPEQVPDLQGLIPARADADRADRGADHLLHRADVGARAGRQLVERPGLGDVLPPAVEVLVDGHRVVELGLRHRDLVVALAVHLVAHADRYLVQAGQDVQLGQEVAGDAVHPGRVPGDDRVEPAAAARPAGGHAVLATRLAQPFAGVVAQFGGEGPLADAGRVGLDDADDVGDPGRADAGPDAGAARGGGGGGDERVGAVVHVEHGGLGALQQHHLALVQRPAQDQAGVGHVGTQPFGVPLVLGRDRLRFDPAPVVDLGQDLVLLAQHQVELLPQDAGIEQVLDADADPGDLVAVGRADAAAGGADPRAAQ